MFPVLVTVDLLCHTLNVYTLCFICFIHYLIGKNPVIKFKNRNSEKLSSFSQLTKVEELGKYTCTLILPDFLMILSILELTGKKRLLTLLYIENITASQ